LELTLPALLVEIKKMEKNFLLNKYNTMHVASTARYFLEAKDKEDIIKGISFAREKKLPFFVLGGGSNVIFPPVYEGVVLFMANKKFEVKEKDEKIYLLAGAGAFLPDVSREVTRKLGKGIEWAGGVPGTVGGAVRGNAGAFGDFTADYVEEVEALDTNYLQEKTFTLAECLFAYRESFFKKSKNYIVLSVKMEFPKKKKEDGKFAEYLSYRKEHHPTEPSAGSIFKNPKVENDFYEHYPQTRKFKDLGFVPMRFLVEECGLQGKSIGGAQIAKKHSNFIINTGKATQKDIKSLILLVKNEIKERFNISVEEEVEVVEQ
jgi:UDP-N-acetylmuramate dehydrogenase